MKNVYLNLLCGLMLASCVKSNVTIVVTNPTEKERLNEMVEVNLDELSTIKDSKFVVYNEDNIEIPYQKTYDGKLIFMADVEANASNKYTVAKGKPQEYPVKACGNYYKLRLEDIAWENDKVAFRAFGPALQNRGDKAYGYDLFLKRGTDMPVLPGMYKNQTDPAIRQKIAELKKTDRKAAGELSRAMSYHVDHGNGMDCYAVGPTLGAGTAALISNDTIYYPWCYKEYEFLDNGPLRCTIKLKFGGFDYMNSKGVVENRIITLDTGSQFNKTHVYYENLKDTASIVVGIVLHQENSASDMNAESRYMTCFETASGKDNGEIYMGAVVPGSINNMKTLLYPEEERKNHGKAFGHVMSESSYDSVNGFTYYWGYAWNKAQHITSLQDWNKHVAEFAYGVNNPLKVHVIK